MISVWELSERHMLGSGYSLLWDATMLNYDYATGRDGDAYPFSGDIIARTVRGHKEEK